MDEGSELAPWAAPRRGSKAGRPSGSGCSIESPESRHAQAQGVPRAIDGGPAPTRATVDHAEELVEEDNVLELVDVLGPHIGQRVQLQEYI